MKEWIITHTHDYENFNTTIIKDVNAVQAIVTFELKYPNEMISEVREKEC